MPNVDLDLLIRTVFKDGRTRVSYILQSPSGKAGFSYREITGPELPGQPRDYQAYLITKIEKLGEGRDIDGSPLLNEEIERKLIKIGRELYLELFPPEMRQAYREIRRQEIQSIRIVSDEPWIPWELIKPFDGSLPDDVLDDEFLCLQFELTRWLSGDRAPVPLSELRARRLACILTATSLPKAGEEKAFLAELAQARPGVEDASPVLSSASAAEAFLEAGGVDLLHFAGHGTFDAAQPNESALPFPDGSVLRPTDLQGPLAARIAQDRPLVFLNACSVGQQSWSLTRLGGWVDRWVRICGCGAFVAPLWPVRDSLALEFARTFYNALASGETFGQASRSARLHVRKLAPGNPSWLAYSIYADVHGRLALGDSQLPELLILRNAAPEIRKKIIDFGPLIAQKTRGFVGREWLFDAVGNFVAKEEKGYVLILGDPGIGKTTLVAEMARRHEDPHHFNIRSEGIQRPEQFLPNVCAQLIAKFGLGDSTLPPDVARDSAVLKTLLARAAAKLHPQGRKLLLLVDALDETDPRAVLQGANTLYLPVDLPAGVFVIVTSRRGGYKLKLACPEHVIDLQAESANNFADVRLFAESWLGREGIRAYLRAQNLDALGFVDELVQRSEGNFMYLHYVLPEIERGAYSTRSFETLPVGLASYYEDHWCRMRDGNPAAWFDYKLPVLVALAIAREPISVSLISDFSGIKGRARIQEVLDEWSPFLQAAEVQEGDEMRTRYRLYHESFHDFIAAKDQVQQEKVDLKEANRKAADSLWRELFPEG
jgi:CHAT domain-containing protein/AAA ATPase-like protein